jgi:hypothetical protein
MGARRCGVLGGRTCASSAMVLNERDSTGEELVVSAGCVERGVWRVVKTSACARGCDFDQIRASDNPA